MKSRAITFILCLFLGNLGIHRFYVGRNKSGLIMFMLTVFSPFTLFTSLIVTGIWATIDFIMILMGKFKDKQGNYIKEW